MSPDRPLEPRATAAQEPIDTDARFWSLQWIPVFEQALLAESTHLRKPTDISDLYRMTIRAMLSTLIDSGMSPESFIDLVGHTLSEMSPPEATWSAESNRRRLALIDKQIQQSISLAEQLELARLTAQMRAQVDTEINLPLQGARAIHKRLLAVERKDSAP
jgi:hypothetical protein